MSIPPRPESNGGFTLVESLLAVAIAALLFTGAFWSLDQAITTRNTLSNMATPYTVGPAILDVIANDLANAYFYDLKDNNCFYGSDAEILGRQADALSFVSLSKTYAPENFGADDDRDSYANEIGYVCRTGTPGTPFLELWRREDWFVDDHLHAGGDFVMLYDKVHSLSLKFVSRNPQTDGGGVGGARQKSAEDMLQDGWNSVKERGVPRAVQITLNIFARDSEQAVDVAAQENEARLYTFQRYVALPQIDLSLDSEQKIAGWDGKLNEARGNRTANKQGQAGQPGQPGGQPAPGARGGAGARRGQRGGNNPLTPGTNVPASGTNNPFFQALRNNRGGSRPQGAGAANLGALFGGGR